MNARFGAVVASLLFCLWSHLAWASMSVYVLAIGYNGGPPAGSSGESNEAPLRYADDDAASFYEFARDFSREARLLTLMDADTQSRFPRDVAEARPPTLTELRAQVRQLHRFLDDDRAKGNESTVLFFYSGHGSRPKGAPPSLTLLDGTLTRDVLYDEVLSELPARYIHLFIDACYAEAIVRPRDADAVAVDLTESDIAHYASHTTLARFPNVGAMVAASTSSQTHEWDVYRHGVFTHELLSGLRGGADVNVDGRIEYSELYAFLASANRDVSDSRARLSVVARPPAANARVAIVDLTQLKSVARIAGIPSSAGQLYLEDQFGNRLADVHVEAGAQLALTVPADKRLYLRCRSGEAEVLLRADQTLAFDRLTLEPPAARMRGVLDLAMRRGLFTTGFGPNYYRGFIDQTQTSQFVSVPLPEPDAPNETTNGAGLGFTADVAEQKVKSTQRGLRALYVAGGATEGVGRGLGPLMALRFGLRPIEPTGFTLGIDGALGRTSSFGEWRILGSAGYRVGTRRNRFSGCAGTSVGGGILGQKTSSGSNTVNSGSAWTGAFFIAPTLGISYELGDQVAIGSEAALSAIFYRRDAAFAASLLPAVYVGVAMGL